MLRQQRQGRLQNTALLGWITRSAQGRAAAQAGECGPRRHGQAGYAGVPTRQCCRNPGFLQGASGQSHGLTTERSAGNKQRRLSTFGFCRRNNRRDQRIQHPAYIGLIAHEADHIRRQRADRAGANEIVQVA